MRGVYAVRDRVAKGYLTLTMYPNDAAAMRAFSDAVREAESPFAKHPADYELHKLGEFRDDDELDAPRDKCPLQGHEVEVVVTALACVEVPNAG